MSALAARAPEQVASGHGTLLDRGVTDQTALTSSPVHVDLPAVSVDPRRASHGLRGVLGAYRVDTSAGHPGAHEHDEIVPDGVERGCSEITARRGGVDSMPKEHLGAVDVAHPCGDRLVHEQFGDGPATGSYPTPRDSPVRVVSDGVGTQAFPHPAPGCFVEQFTGLGATQIRIRDTITDAQSHLTSYRGVRGQGERADEPQMDVDEVFCRTVDVDDEVLSPGVRCAQGLTVQHGCLGSEPALWGAHLDRPTGKGVVERTGKTMNDVTLRHETLPDG